MVLTPQPYSFYCGGSVHSRAAPPEQLLFSERVANTGAGLIVNHRDSKQLVTGISEVTSKERYRNRAQNFASRSVGHDQRALDAQLERLIERNQSAQ